LTPRASHSLQLVQGAPDVVDDVTRSDEPDDATLMARTAADDAAAFAMLVERHEASIRGFVRTLVHGEEDDLTQQVFTQLWRHRHRYREQGAFKAFLFQVARNAGRKRLRSLRVQRLFRGRAQHNVVTTTSTPALDDRLQTQADVAALHTALQHLGADDRALLHLRFVDELPFNDISVVLQVSSATLRKRCQRALHRLRHHLPPDVGGLA